MKLFFVSIALFFVGAVGCCGKPPVIPSIDSLPAADRELIRHFFEITPGSKLQSALVIFNGDRHLVLMNQQREKAVVLIVNNDAKDMTEVVATGYFIRHKDGWEHDSRRAYELQSGIWLLDRFLKVLERAQVENRYQVVAWRCDKGSGCGY